MEESLESRKLVEELESMLQAGEKNGRVEIVYSVCCADDTRDFFINIHVSKMNMLIKGYVFKAVQGESKGTIQFDKSELVLLDGTTLVGQFDVKMAARLGEDGIGLAETSFVIEPLPPVWKGSRDFSNIVGANYTNSSAVNEIQFWMEFNEAEISRELGYAESIGINSLRVFLHNHPYDRQPGKFFANINRFLTIADRYKIRTILIFFDDCWYGDERVFVFEPVPGEHNGRWAKCPLIHERVITNYARFRSYIQNTIIRFKDDTRILAWEIWNEPKNCGTGNQIVDPVFTQDLMVNGFQWAREANPSQPLITCWDGNAYGDIDDQHNYSREWKYSPGTAGNEPDEKRGTLVTEAGARIWGEESDSYGSPTEWIYWLKDRKAKGLPRPGVYLTWELMVGNSNCKWHWSSKYGEEEPSIPWCGLFYPDGTPVSIAEMEAIRSYTMNESGCLLYSDFQDGTADGWDVISGQWDVVSSGNLSELVSKAAEPTSLIVAGDAAWMDYTVQAVVMLRENSEKGAGLVVRAAGESTAQTDGYYCGFNTEEIYIYCIVNGRERKLVSKNAANIRLNVRNSLKVTVHGNSISVYLNDPTRAVIECIDDAAVLKSGKTGLFSSGCSAVFDDIAVVPIN